MIIHMNDDLVTSIEDLEGLSGLPPKVEFTSQNKKETYAWVEGTLQKFRYFSLRKKKGRMMVRQYIETFSGLSRSQITRLIKRKKATGRILVKTSKRHAFPRRYTVTDVALLAETDKAHDHLSGPATKRIFERQYQVYGQAKYERIAAISISHLYNIRDTRQYRSETMFFSKTRLTRYIKGI
jgi:hypothetical protein